MGYKGKGFDSDRAQKQENLRFEMAKKYSSDKRDYFGPDESEASEIYKDHKILTHEERKTKKNEMEVSEAGVKAGFNQVLEKNKRIRQQTPNTLISGTRSGSEKIVLKYFDLLKEIYSEASSTTEMPSSVDIISVNSDSNAKNSGTTGYNSLDDINKMMIMILNY